MTESPGRHARLLLAELLSNELGLDLDGEFLAATDKLLIRLWLSGYAVLPSEDRPASGVTTHLAECLSEELGIDNTPHLVTLAQRLVSGLRSRGVDIVLLGTD